MAIFEIWWFETIGNKREYRSAGPSPYGEHHRLNSCGQPRSDGEHVCYIEAPSLRQAMRFASERHPDWTPLPVLRETIKFELAEPRESKDYRGSSHLVEVLTDMRQHCSRCKKTVLGEPMSLEVVDVVSHQERGEAQRAVAVAMYNASPHIDSFEELPWTVQCGWLREAAESNYYVEHFRFDAIGLGLDAKLRSVGVEEARKWRAYTNKRKLFRVNSAHFPSGWLHLSFQARGSKDGQPVQHGNVQVHICPECAPVIFDAANVDPAEPFGDGVRW